VLPSSRLSNLVDTRKSLMEHPDQCKVIIRTVRGCGTFIGMFNQKLTSNTTGLRGHDGISQYPQNPFPRKNAESEGSRRHRAVGLPLALNCARQGQV
jgi:hypothetical protein